MVGGISAFYFRERRQFLDRISELSKRLTASERALNEFIEESEKVAREFSRRLPSPRAPLASANAPDTPGASPRKRKSTEKKTQVLNLAGKGRAAKEIAERLMLPAGEVELIMNLDSSRKAQPQAAQ